MWLGEYAMHCATHMQFRQERLSFGASLYHAHISAAVPSLSVPAGSILRGNEHIIDHHHSPITCPYLSIPCAASAFRLDFVIRSSFFMTTSLSHSI